MRTVITSTGNDIKSLFDKRFGRAAWFCVYDDATDETTFHENKFADSNHGAGTRVSEEVVEWGVQKAISGDFGPKAKDLLEKFKIQMVVIAEEETVESIINKLKTKK
jgi:predicted Fe-Mo cluster-binding NifX family protein